ncbi:hypothetical protein D3C73_1085250 [compost metagenome]
MQIENRQARVAALGFACREKAAAVGERQQVTDLGTLPGAIGDAGGQHLIEQKTARRGEQTRAHVALLRQGLARGPGASIDDVAAVMAEALCAEIVRDAVFNDQLQAFFDSSLVASELGEAQSKAVGRVGTALQFALVAGGLEDLQRIVFRSRQIRVGLARQLHAEPLASQRLTVLEPGITDGAQWHAGSLGNPSRRFFSIQTTLFHPDPQVFAFATEGNVEDFVDLEIFGDRFQDRRAEGLTVSPRAEQLQFVHARSNKATECTAMPSSRPTKPSFSVVVAFTFT